MLISISLTANRTSNNTYAHRKEEIKNSIGNEERPYMSRIRVPRLVVVSVSLRRSNGDGETGYGTGYGTVCRVFSVPVIVKWVYFQILLPLWPCKEQGKYYSYYQAGCGDHQGTLPYLTSLIWALRLEMERYLTYMQWMGSCIDNGIFLYAPVLIPVGRHLFTLPFFLLLLLPPTKQNKRQRWRGNERSGTVRKK